jgi:hypothetical protein
VAVRVDLRAFGRIGERLDQCLVGATALAGIGAVGGGRDRLGPHLLLLRFAHGGGGLADERAIGARRQGEGATAQSAVQVARPRHHSAAADARAEIDDEIEIMRVRSEAAAEFCAHRSRT